MHCCLTFAHSVRSSTQLTVLESTLHCADVYCSSDKALVQVHVALCRVVLALHQSKEVDIVRETKEHVSEMLIVMSPRLAWIRGLCLSVLLAAAIASSENHKKWTPSTYPNPQKDVNLCGRNGVKSSICDPENILSIEAANMVDGLINEIAEGKPPYHRAQCGDDASQGFQVSCPSAACTGSCTGFDI